MSMTGMSSAQLYAQLTGPGNKRFSAVVNRPVLYPTNTMPLAALNQAEEVTISTTLKHIADSIDRTSTVVGSLFRAHTDFFLVAAMIAKAKFQATPNFPASDRASALYSAEVPDAGQIGISPIGPPDILNGTSSSTPPSTWDQGAPASVPATTYLIGGSTYSFSTAGTEPKRYILALMQNGLVEIGGNTPSADQGFYTTTQNSYVPWYFNPTYDTSVETQKPVYIYDTPGAIIMDETIVSKLSIRQIYQTATRIALIGIKIYEYNYYTAFV
jgi:hypothetical protein